MNQKFLTILVVTFFAFSIAATANSADRQNFIIKYGVMKRATSTTDKLNETQKITMDPTRRPGWCFIVDPPNKVTYEIYSVHFLPEKPKRLTGDFKDMKPDSAQKGFKTTVRRTDGIRPFCFEFHSGDTVGKYRVEVFINKKLNSTLHLDVVAKHFSE